MFNFQELKVKYGKQVKDWYKYSFEPKYRIEKYSGTWLHWLGFFLHFGLFKVLACFNFRNSLEKQKSCDLGKDRVDRLSAKVVLYKELMKKQQDQFGFVMTDKCDSALYSGLVGSVGVKVDIKAAKNNNGYWERRPLISCYKNGSKSSFSRDMLIGLLWWIWRNKDLELAKELYTHFKENNFVMGLGDPSRLLVMSGLEATLAEIIFRLGGENHFLARRQKQSWPKNLSGYEEHLLVLHALLRGEIQGGLENEVLEVLEHYGKDSCFVISKFAYALYFTGDLNASAECLLDERFWPSDRLPTNKDRSADWLHTQDNPKDYQPSTDSDVHEFAGADLVFYGSLILEAAK